ncbi:MAG: DNA topoisomerase IV subunit A [Erysipelotrichales bacterium]|nr:DNA topoisomerase IV subunit A [Erysipelotrichales bacterium]
MAKKKVVEEEVINENIQTSPLEYIMGDRFATYAKYVIQDRAIPDVRDGLKPVQRRIIYAMYLDGNVSSKPTRKCAHTVGAVMGKFHPHGDTSIYNALARMSQDWKVRLPLIDFQGNNGSIDGDGPAAYRYTEARLSEAAEEMIRDLNKETVDMQLTFDDTMLEPVVLPSRFPNLLVNGSEGIAVAVATDIPPHNLREVIDATIYALGHKNATNEDLMEFVKGPDFPTGGIIYDGEGLKSIYTTGRGRIEVVSKTEVVEGKNINQIIVSEIPYGTLKSEIVYEIDKICHDRSVDGMLEVRDESDRTGLRIAIDLRKDAKTDVVLNYLMAKTKLKSSYTANMVAIVDDRPKTLDLKSFVQAYVNHQVDVVTRKSKFDLEKQLHRLHILEGLIKAVSVVDEVVRIIRRSKDKADSKKNLIERFAFSEIQAEAIVNLQLYKLSNTDITTFMNEKAALEASIHELKEILADEKKLHKVIIKDLKAIADKYGDVRRTVIEEKGETITIDKRDLIAKEDVYVVLTRDGYAKRSTLKSQKSSDGALPGIKNGDIMIGSKILNTMDYVLAFTNKGNYCFVPVHELQEGKWKDEGKHISYVVNLGSDEKIIRVIAVSEFRDDLSICLITKKGQIKKTVLSEFFTTRYVRPLGCMRLLGGDEVVDAVVLSGNSNIAIFTKNGLATFFNENEFIDTGIRTSGVKAMAIKADNEVVRMFTLLPEERAKFIMITDNGCERICESSYLTLTPRLGRQQYAFKSFKSDPHDLVFMRKIKRNSERESVILMLDDKDLLNIEITDFKPTPADKYAKKNLDSLKGRRTIIGAYEDDFEFVNSDFKALKGEDKLPKMKISKAEEEEVEEKGYEQISIFDDLGD